MKCRVWLYVILSLALCFSSSYAQSVPTSPPSSIPTQDSLALSSEEAFSEACSRIEALAIDTAREEEGAAILDLLSTSEKERAREWKEHSEKLSNSIKTQTETQATLSAMQTAHRKERIGLELALVGEGILALILGLAVLLK